MRNNQSSVKPFLSLLLAVTVITTFVGVSLFYGKKDTNTVATSEVKQARDVTITAMISTQEIRVRAYPEKRHPNLNNWDTFLDFAVINESTHQVAFRETIHTDSAGIGEVTLLPSDVIPPGENPVYIKGLSHLSRMYQAIDFDTVGVFIDVTPYGDLLAGDTHISNDDFINSLDISTLCNALNTSNDRNDLNDDSTVNSLDLSRQIFNIGKAGDGLQL